MNKFNILKLILRTNVQKERGSRLQVQRPPHVPDIISMVSTQSQGVEKKNSDKAALMTHRSKRLKLHLAMRFKLVHFLLHVPCFNILRPI